MKNNELVILFLAFIIILVASWLSIITDRVTVIEHGLDAALVKKMECEQ